jgi:cytochrome c556
LRAWFPEVAAARAGHAYTAAGARGTRGADRKHHKRPGKYRMNRSVKSLLIVALAIAAGAAAFPAAAQFAKAEDAIKYRRAGMTLMSAHFGRVAAMASGKAPFDAKAAADNAEIATYMSKLPFAGFVAGSDKGETRAEPKIWTEMDKFRSDATKMQDAMAKLDVAAKSGDLDQIKAAVGETGKSCKACHDAYRKD